MIGQSVAAFEYLEEAYPSPPLLPPTHEPAKRAKARQLVQIIASDTQPLINRKVADAIKDLGGSREDWARTVTERGLRAFEGVVKETAGMYCMGDEVSVADVVLCPMMWNAEAYGVDFRQMPVIRGIYERCMQLDAFKNAHWSCQEDCPEEYASGREKLPAY